jgi:uridine kinase
LAVTKLRDLIRSPYFAAGLVVRLAMILLLTPVAAADWYAPFIGHAFLSWAPDPWTSFLGAGGDSRAFPYGYAMLLSFLPAHLLLGAWSSEVAYLITLLAFDFGMLVLLRELLSDTDARKLLLLYWLSPIVIFATYWMGLNDVVPVAFLFAAIAALERGRPVAAGALAALAVSAKLSMVLALPILVIYLIHNRPARRFLPGLAASLVGAGLVLIVPHLLSAGGREMLLGNPELQKVYELALPYGQDGKIYVLPAAYLLALYAIWRFKRLRFDLLIAALAITFLLVLLLSPAAPGWFVWVLPCLVWFQDRSDRVSLVLVMAFSALYVVQMLMTSPLAAPLAARGGPLSLNAVFAPTAHFVSLSQTLFAALGIVIAFRLFRQGVQLNEYFRLSRRPLVIGVAGDSGAGKDTLVGALAGLFGTHSSIRLSGDDYHLWDRHRPVWRAMTHLNPRANDLSQFSADVAQLAAGQGISLRHYDHELGRAGKAQKVASNDFVLASGLHALFLPALRSSYDLSIYLDMDDGLRRWLKLKRDTQERGYPAESVHEVLQRREADAARFVRPQRKVADLVLSVRPLTPVEASTGAPDTEPRLTLHIRSRNSAGYDELIRMLVSFAGLGVESSIEEDGGISLVVEGEIAAKDVQHVAEVLLPQIRDLLDREPDWRDGVLGLMQLIVLVEATLTLRKRTA